MEKRSIDVIEVGPRDGLQNLKEFLPTEQKVSLIERILECGVRHMQITSFVSPRAIPQMSDAAEVCRAVLSRHSTQEADLCALVPNLRGARAAWNAGLRKVNNVISLSATHNKANINRTHDESFAELALIREQMPELEVILDAATAFGCPFEGKYLDPKPLLAYLRRAYDLGVRTFNLCDTVGLADPMQVRRIVTAVRETFADVRIEIHIHDTRGMGLVNTLAAIEAGADGVQSTLGGLGGCPFAPGASGNTATEDMVYMLNEMGYDTSIDVTALISAAKYEYSVIPDGIFSGHLLHIATDQDCCITK
ncbi:hydroxymethylglutaryl-CoA lyase [Caproicibacter fermentans]|uniref:Hydroxymethylglutaryl-CoA lyase n=1 Tax=Caproicibacter fermentans TaxID=2576756 RepID=A0A7G8T7P5_9FIRM|nr:hydroxymethylglutaryl-CoA lyase [Caproicibacter fermentans]QNK39636.1 hydroxymethylglutaryl-CoA lyase [Caproicibacter fermentans]